MAVTERGSLRFGNIKLSNWRNFKKADVALQGRVFVIGPNASGKSNFLDCFRFLHDLVSFGGGFQEAVGRRGGVSKLRCHAARRNPDVEIDVRIVDADGKERWKYTLGFKQNKMSIPLIVKEEIIRGGKKKIVMRPDEDDNADQERLRQTALEQVNVNKEFRELVDFFRSVRYLHLVPQLIREPERYRSVSERSPFRSEYDPFGGDFLDRIASVNKKTRDAWLRRIGDALKLVVPQLKELEFYRDEKLGVPHLRAKFEHWRPQGAWQTEEQFSDGTLRLIGLLWSVLEKGGPLLLEEPELSLHPAIVRHLPAMFARMQQRSGRQVLLSSHSADILQDEGIALDEVLILKPGREGTEIVLASSIDEVHNLVENGIPLADVALSESRPSRPEQLPLFVK
ncbi:MAG: chromosome segregation protein SMC [Gammaproteobacteria bacterium]|nr:MAG: chromosome segregation protein SMC [Gammaproteobacteria bacterium]